MSKSKKNRKSSSSSSATGLDRIWVWSIAKKPASLEDVKEHGEFLTGVDPDYKDNPDLISTGCDALAEAEEGFVFNKGRKLVFTKAMKKAKKTRTADEWG